jgi:hypothetical protein
MLRVALVARQRHELITGRSNRKFHNQRENAALAVADCGRDIVCGASAPHSTIMTGIMSFLGVCSSYSSGRLDGEGETSTGMQKTLEEESDQLGFLEPLRYNTSVFAQLRAKLVLRPTLCLAKDVTERIETRSRGSNSFGISDSPVSAHLTRVETLFRLSQHLCHR